MAEAPLPGHARKGTKRAGSEVLLQAKKKKAFDLAVAPEIFPAFDPESLKSFEDTPADLRPIPRDQRRSGGRVGTGRGSSRVKSGSRFQGVSQMTAGGRWFSEIRAARKTVFLGTFDTEEEAGIAFARAGFKHDRCLGRRSKQQGTDFSHSTPGDLDGADGMGELGDPSDAGTMETTTSSASRGAGEKQKVMEEGGTIDLTGAPENLEPIDRVMGRPVGKKAKGSSAAASSKVRSSRYQGVFPTTSNRWFSNIQIDGKRLYLGSFDSEREAGVVYARACWKRDQDRAAQEQRATQQLMLQAMQAAHSVDQATAVPQASPISIVPMLHLSIPGTIAIPCGPACSPDMTYLTHPAPAFASTFNGSSGVHLQVVQPVTISAPQEMPHPQQMGAAALTAAPMNASSLTSPLTSSSASASLSGSSASGSASSGVSHSSQSVSSSLEITQEALGPSADASDSESRTFPVRAAAHVQVQVPMGPSAVAGALGPLLPDPLLASSLVSTLQSHAPHGFLHAGQHMDLQRHELPPQMWSETQHFHPPQPAVLAQSGYTLHGHCAHQASRHCSGNYVDGTLDS